MSVNILKEGTVCINPSDASERNASDWMINWVTPSDWLNSWIEYGKINLNKVRTGVDALKSL